MNVKLIKIYCILQKIPLSDRAAFFLSKSLAFPDVIWYNTTEVVAAAVAGKAGCISLSEQFSRSCVGDCRKGGDTEVEIMSVLSELIGEAIHILTLNASSLGALLAQFREWIKSKRA